MRPCPSEHSTLASVVQTSRRGSVVGDVPPVRPHGVGREEVCRGHVGQIGHRASVRLPPRASARQTRRPTPVPAACRPGKQHPSPGSAGGSSKTVAKLGRQSGVGERLVAVGAVMLNHQPRQREGRSSGKGFIGLQRGVGAGTWLVGGSPDGGGGGHPRRRSPPPTWAWLAALESRNHPGGHRFRAGARLPQSRRRPTVSGRPRRAQAWIRRQVVDGSAPRQCRGPWPGRPTGGSP